MLSLSAGACWSPAPVTLRRVAGRGLLLSSRGLTDGCTEAGLLLYAPGGAIKMQASRDGALEAPCDKLSAYVAESEPKLSGFHVDTCTSQLAQHNLLVGPPPSHLLIAFSRQHQGNHGAFLGTKVNSFPNTLMVSISPSSSDGFVKDAIVSLKDVKAQTKVHEYINSDTYIMREDNHFVTVVLGATATVLDDGKAVQISPNSISSRLQKSAILCLYKLKGSHAAVHHRLINIEMVEQELST